MPIRLTFSSKITSPTGRGVHPRSTSRLAEMATTALASNDLPGIVLNKEEEFFLKWYRTFKVVDKETLLDSAYGYFPS